MLHTENTNIEINDELMAVNGIPPEHIHYMRGQSFASVQDVINQDMFEEDENKGNDMLEMLHFMKNNSVPLTDEQAQGVFLLHEYGLDDIAEFVLGVRPLLTPQKSYFDTINKITLADRIRGTAKLSNLLKAQVANPNNQMPNAKEYQAQAMRESELRR